MTARPGVILQIWDMRIKGIEQKISDLKKIGLSNDDYEIQELYQKLEYFRQCRRQTQIDFALQNSRHWQKQLAKCINSGIITLSKE